MKHITCNICGHDDTRIVCYGKDRLMHTDDIKFKTVQCKHCGLVYINPQLEPRELSKYYPDSYGSYSENKEIFKYSVFGGLLKKFVKKMNDTKHASQTPSIEDSSKKTYLDFGCGGSRGLENAKRAHPNWDIYGFDNNPKVCKQIQKKGFKAFCGDIADIALPKNFFDVVNMSSVIEHVYDPKYTMKKLNTSLKKGGVVVIRTPNYNSFSRVLFQKFWVFMDSPRHLFLFTRKTLGTLLHDTGFEVEKIEFLPNPYPEIKSFYYLLHKKDRRMSPVTWRILRPFSSMLAKVGMSGTIIVTAHKHKDVV